MKIGLVRHFKVSRGYPNTKYISRNELLQWMEEYEASDVEPIPVDLGATKWSRCIASDIPRAVRTAREIYPGEPALTKDLREVPFQPPFKRNIKLNGTLWYTLISIGIFLSHRSQPESRRDIVKRVKNVIADVTAEGEDTLIVSHGAIMQYLRRELLRRGFKGPKIQLSINGKLYVFEKP